MPRGERGTLDTAHGVERAAPPCETSQPVRGSNKVVALMMKDRLVALGCRSRALNEPFAVNKEEVNLLDLFAQTE